MLLGHSLVSWKCKKQSPVSWNSAEAKYRSMVAASNCELTWLRYSLADLHIPHPPPSLLHDDNKAALHISSNPIFHERTKHIGLDCHLVCDKIADGTLSTAYVPSGSQLADILTKPLPSPIFWTLLLKMGVSAIYSPSCRGY